MHQNPLWLIFLSAAIIVTAIYTGFSFYALWQYIRLDKHIPAQQIEWSVVELSDDQFSPYAHYQFFVQGREFHGESQWHERYLNEWTAKEAIARLKRSPPSVWYDGSHPQVSQLEKIFPLKESLYTASLWFLTLYFFCLGWYVKGRKM